MTADNFFGRVAHGVEEILVGLQNCSVQSEFDDRLRSVERRDHSLSLNQLLAHNGPLRL